MRVKKHLVSDRASHIFKHQQNSEHCRTLCSRDCFHVLHQPSTSFQLRKKEWRPFILRENNPLWTLLPLQIKFDSCLLKPPNLPVILLARNKVHWVQSISSLFDCLLITIDYLFDHWFIMSGILEMKLRRITTQNWILSNIASLIRVSPPEPFWLSQYTCNFVSKT